MNAYIHFHYNDEPYFSVPNYPKAVAELALSYTDEKRRLRALDLGCATGRTSFELAKHFEHVSGIDYAQKLVDVAVQLQTRCQTKRWLLRRGLLLKSTMSRAYRSGGG